MTLPSSAVVGTAGAGRRDVERQLDVAAVLTVAESVGAMDEIFETTVDYAKVRTAFGRPIGSFQAVKHLLADTSLLVEQSKAIAVAAAQAVQEERSKPSEVASMAKAFVGEAGDRAGAELLAGVRRHRVHVGARPPPLPAAADRRRVALRRAGVAPRAHLPDPRVVGESRGNG